MKPPSIPLRPNGFYKTIKQSSRWKRIYTTILLSRYNLSNTSFIHHLRLDNRWPTQDVKQKTRYRVIQKMVSTSFHIDKRKRRSIHPRPLIKKQPAVTVYQGLWRIVSVTTIGGSTSRGSSNPSCSRSPFTVEARITLIEWLSSHSVCACRRRHHRRRRRRRLCIDHYPLKQISNLH